jgi:hypothetical protein
MDFNGADQARQRRSRDQWGKWASQAPLEVVAFANQLAVIMGPIVTSQPSLETGAAFRQAYFGAYANHRVTQAQALDAVLALSRSWLYGEQLEGWYTLYVAMEFKGGRSERSRQESWRLWQQWLSQYRQNPALRRVAIRFVALLESRLTPRTKRFLRDYAPDALDRAEADTRQEFDLPPDWEPDMSRLLGGLFECWAYGDALYAWARHHRYVR